MFGFMLPLFAVMFVLVFAMIIAGFVRHARLSGRIFELAERRMEEALRSGTSHEPAARTCAHCGRADVTEGECPNCGAPVA